MAGRAQWLEAALVLLVASSNLAAAGAATSGDNGGDCDLHPAFRARIEKDVAWLDRVGGITEGMIRNISLVCDKHIRHQCNIKVLRVMIKDGEVYLNSMHPNFKLGPHIMIGFIMELYEASKLYKLPDVEFAFNGDDDANWAFQWKDTLQTNFHGGPFPLVAWSKSELNSAILIPDHGAFRCMHDGFDVLVESLNEIRKLKWNERKQVAFGRWTRFCPIYMLMGMPQLPSGEPYKCPRAWLPRVSLEVPDMLDLGYIGERSQYGDNDTKLKDQVPLLHQAKYRYLVSTDGVATSRKMEIYFLFGSLVIKSMSNRLGFFYDALKADQHYVNCLNSSSRDIVDTVRWAREHDAQAARIAAAGQRFAATHLRRSSRLCHLRTVIQELGKRMRYVPDCSRRALCVPLGHLLQFMSTHPPSMNSCVNRFHEVLTAYPPNPAALGTYTTYAPYKLQELLADKLLWPRDNLVPESDEEPYFAVPRL